MTRILALLAIAALIILTGLAALPVRAQDVQRAGLPDALQGLSQRYAEAPRVQGLTAAGHMLVITQSATGSWSALLVSPDGQACMVAFGEALEVIEAVKPGIDG